MILLLMDCQSLLLVYTLAVTSVFGLLEQPMLQAQPGHHHTHSHSNVESSKLGILQCGIVEEYFNSTVCVYVCVWCVCVVCVCVCVRVRGKEGDLGQLSPDGLSVKVYDTLAGLPGCTHGLLQLVKEHTI